MINKKTKASVMESSYWDMDQNICCNTMFLLSHIKSDLNIDILKESLKYVVQTIPILSCRLSKGFWRDKWIPIDNFEAKQLVTEIRVGKDNFFENAYSEFLKLKNKKIDVEREPLYKILVFYNEEIDEKVLIFCVHHILADGRGAFQLVELTGQYYSGVLRNNFVLQKNNRKISKLIFSLNARKILKMMNLKVIFERKPKEFFEPLLSMDKIIDEDFGIGIERILIEKADLEKVKAYYKDYNFTINDIILHITLKLLEKYNLELEKPSKNLAIALGVDLRKYLDKDMLSISNYSGTEMLKIDIKDVNNKQVVETKLKELKKKTIGLGFIIQPILQSIFPIAIQKKMLTVLKDFINKWSLCSIQTTNVGKVDDYIKPFGVDTQKFSFIGPSPYCGFPLISVSGFKDTITIYFTKYNDIEGLCLKVSNDFKYLLNEFVDKKIDCRNR